MNARLQRRAWILYWAQGLNLEDVGGKLGLSRKTMKKRWEEWGFPLRTAGPRTAPRKLSPEDVAEILELVQTKSQAEVARHFGVSRVRINQLVKEHLRCLSN